MKILPALLLAFACLGAAVHAGEPFKWPDSAPVAGAQLAPNEWVKIEEHGAARRGGGALVYLANEKSFLLTLGTVGAWNDHGPFAYDEQTFNLTRRQWTNRFPAGSAWKPEVGPCDAPKLPHHGYRLKDGRLGLWEGGFTAYTQYAMDTDRNKLVAYVNNHTIEYDATARAWKDLAPAAVPNGTGLDLWWGSLCYDPVNKEFVLFGGNNGPSAFNDTRTWLYSAAKNEWRPLNAGSAQMQAFFAKAETLRKGAEGLHAAYANRCFKTELPEQAAAKLSAQAGKLAAALSAFKQELAGKSAYEKVQCERAAAELASAADAAGALGDEGSSEQVKAALDVARTLWRAQTALMSEPPPRALSQLVYDPASKSIVLFGGDRLDMLYADTWVYDCATRTWQERRPELSPSPRAGHALVSLPKAGKLVLLGGYRFASDTGYWGPLYQPLPTQAWVYDVAANAWTFAKDFGKDAPVYCGGRCGWFTVASNEDDVLLAVGNQRLGDRSTAATFACKLDASSSDATAAAKLGVKPGAVEWREGPYEPAWYFESGAPDEAAFQAKLKALPPNTWTALTDKGAKLPRQNRDWGTAVYDPQRQAIYRWSGGHSAHCGSDIPVFSMRTGAYHLKYPPAFPLQNIGSCSSQPSESTFLAQPWISGHTYHSYAYDSVAKKMICCGHHSFSYLYDPDTGLWSHKPQPKGMREDNFYTLTLCATPRGAYAWTKNGGLFKYDAASDAWSAVAVAGEKLPGTACDAASMCYDAKRERLILVHKDWKGDVIAVDLKTSTASKLGPKGGAELDAKGFFWRETCYDEANDLVLVPVRDKAKPWFAFDCAANAWVSLNVSNSPGFGCSNGLMYDPLRKLVLAVDTNSFVYALRIAR